MNIGEIEMPYPAYALLGLTIWQIFAGGLVDCTKSIAAGGSMVVKVNFPKESLVLSSFGDALVGFLMRLVLTIVVFITFKIVPAWTTIFFPIALIPLLLLTLGLGLMFALLNAILRDVANIVSLASMFLLFITPVLYPPPETVFFKKFSILNPLFVLVSCPRDLVLNGSVAHPIAYLFFSLVSLIIFFVSWRLFHLVEKRIAERIGGR
jgi:lipopolysaccharide transport system permease protein